MRKTESLQINEIFWSFQGEGDRMGVASIFLRLAGCTLRCPYCDTTGSWDRGTLCMTVPELVHRVGELQRQFPRSQVVITGGEPLEQDLAPLVAALKAASPQRPYFLAIETNGTRFQDLDLDWWAVSPKDVSDYFIHPDLVPKINEIKLVVNENLDVNTVEHIRQGVGGVPIFLQPGAHDPRRYRGTFDLFRQCRQRGLENIRAGVQLHRIYGVD